MNDSSPQEPNGGATAWPEAQPEYEGHARAAVRPGPFGPPTGGSAPSPYDNPTEELPDTLTVSIPRTGADFDAATEHLPTYPEAETQPTYSFASIPPSTTVPGEPPRSRPGRGYDTSYGRGTLDLGLLLLRLVVGGTFVGTGLMKLTGWWHGDGITGTRHALEHMGWKQPKVSGMLVTVAELGGGAFIVIGLLTPLAAAAVLAVAIDAWLTLQHTQHGLTYNVAHNPGIPLTILLGVGAAAIILTGPGRIAVDVGRGWATRPRAGSFLLFLTAIVAAVLVWIFLHGGNPLHNIF
jgi:putative oxidoreductase